MRAEILGVSRWEDGDSGTDTGDARVGIGPRAGAVAVVDTSGWDGGAGVDTGSRGRLEKWGRQM